MAAAGTIALPGSPYIQEPQSNAPALPAPVAGGAWGQIALPSPTADPTPPPGVPFNNQRPVVGGLVPGSRRGPIPTALNQYPVADPGVYQPTGAAWDNASNYAAGADTPFFNNAFFYDNSEVNDRFQTAGQATTARSTNQDVSSALPASPAPVYRRMVNQGHYRREAFVNEQRFAFGGLSYQATRNIAVQNVLAQPRMTNPYWNRLSNYLSPGSYSAITTTIDGPSSNILPQPYGAY